MSVLELLEGHMDAGDSMWVMTEIGFSIGVEPTSYSEHATQKKRNNHDLTCVLPTCLQSLFLMNPTGSVQSGFLSPVTLPAG